MSEVLRARVQHTSVPHASANTGAFRGTHCVADRGSHINSNFCAYNVAHKGANKRPDKFADSGANSCTDTRANT